MSQVIAIHPTGGVDALKSDGTSVPHKTGVGCALPTTGLWYFQLGDPDALVKHATVKWDATFVGVITLDSTSIPLRRDRLDDDRTAPELADNSDAVGAGWNRENPPSAFISTVQPDGSTAGASATGAVITVTGGTAGCASIHVGNYGSLRLRLRMNVSTAGTVRVTTHEKE